jgi:hypothetical protein
MSAKYREVLTIVDQVTFLHFTATGAPPALRRIRILLINLCVLADNLWNEVITIIRSQDVFKILSLSIADRSHFQ